MSRTQSLARKAVILYIEGMKNLAHSNGMLRIVLNLAIVHWSVLDLTFRRPVPDRPEAVRFISHCCSLLIRDVVMTDEGIITAVDRITPITAVLLDSQDEKTQTTAVLGACKMPLMRMIDSADVSGSTCVPLGGISN